MKNVFEYEEFQNLILPNINNYKTCRSLSEVIDRVVKAYNQELHYFEDDIEYIKKQIAVDYAISKDNENETKYSTYESIEKLTSNYIDGMKDEILDVDIYDNLLKSLNNKIESDMSKGIINDFIRKTEENYYIVNNLAFSLYAKFVTSEIYYGDNPLSLLFNMTESKPLKNYSVALDDTLFLINESDTLEPYYIYILQSQLKYDILYEISKTVNIEYFDDVEFRVRMITLMDSPLYGHRKKYLSYFMEAYKDYYESTKLDKEIVDLRKAYIENFDIDEIKSSVTRQIHELQIKKEDNDEEIRIDDLKSSIDLWLKELDKFNMVTYPLMLDLVNHIMKQNRLSISDSERNDMIKFLSDFKNEFESYISEMNEIDKGSEVDRIIDSFSVDFMKFKGVEERVIRLKSELGLLDKTSEVSECVDIDQLVRSCYKTRQWTLEYMIQNQIL